MSEYEFLSECHVLAERNALRGEIKCTTIVAQAFFGLSSSINGESTNWPERRNETANRGKRRRATLYAS